MLIDDYMPAFDVNERHHVAVRAPTGDVYAAVREFDIGDARLTRLLFRLRGLTAPRRFTFDDLMKMRFVILDERPGEEIVLGLTGRFWQPCGELRRVGARSFRDFDEPGYAKAAWNFHLAPYSDGTVRLTTETRVRCTDTASRFKFRLYWSLIGLFSGLIRHEMLRTIKHNAENSHRHQPAHAR